MGEEAKRLAELKQFLERRIEELRRELEALEEISRLVDAALSSASFVRASELAARPQAPPAQPQRKTEAPPRQEAPLSEAVVTSRSTGEKLARVVVYPSRIEIVFLREFSASTPPFESFFVRKVLEGFKRRDEDLIVRGEKSPGEGFDYQIEEDGGVLRRILITNYGEKKVVDEIKSTLRWTLEKMVESERA
uniref:Uncharacterized protein n=1 Tax=Thermofilum pendens TaxID=2269 RepID=A0A7J3X925_THEPE